MDQALTLAATLVRCEPRAGVLVLTDHPPAERDVPASLRPHLTVLNVAEPVDNLALLPPRMTPLADGTYRLEAWLAYWGAEPCHATLAVLRNGSPKSSLQVSLAPGQMSPYEFIVRADEIAGLSVRVERDEPYTLDNQAAPPAWQRRRVFLPDDAPPALQAVVSANPAYRRVVAAAGADICVSLTQDKPVQADAYGPVLVTAALCPDEDTRRAWMTDLFLGPNVSPIPVNDPAVVLLATADGRPLAVRSDTAPPVVTLSPSLFDDGATFWKQPQCPVILDAVLNPAPDRYDNAGAAHPCHACYSDLTLPTADSRAARALPAVRPPVPLTQGILWAALILALCELACYCRGRIV